MQHKKVNSLALARLSVGARQQDLADAVGVARETVSRWETGAWQPSAKSLSALAEALGVEVESIQ